MNNKAKLILVSVWIWLVFIVAIIPGMLLIILTYLIGKLTDKRLVLVHWAATAWAWILLHSCPYWKVKYYNFDNVPKKQACVIVSNHQSMLDILVLHRVHRPFKWVSKAENFKTPVVGWVLTLNECLRIERGKSSSATNLFKAARKTLAMGTSLILFPEGTRSVDGTMRSFKEGAFIMAKESDVPILPIVLDGNYLSLPKQGLMLKQASNIIVKALPVIPVEVVREKSAKELMDYCRTLIANELEAIRAKQQ
jgi:1-acyl-sn-glycerol-3-phosphate acyltransferase